MSFDLWEFIQDVRKYLSRYPEGEVHIDVDSEETAKSAGVSHASAWGALKVQGIETQSTPQGVDPNLFDRRMLHTPEGYEES